MRTMFPIRGLAPFAISLLVGVTVCVALFALLSTRPLHAAQTIPYKMNFQGRLTNNAGNVMPDGLYNLKLKLYDASTAGTLLWSEDRLFGTPDTRVQVTNGLFSIQLGDVAALNPGLFNSSTPRYFEIELPTPATATCATAGCASFTEGPMSPRQALGAAGYAMNADTIDGIDGGSLARQDATNVFTGANLFKNGVDGTANFSVQNAAGTSLLVADTTNMRIGIGTNAPSTTLHAVVNSNQTLPMARLQQAGGGDASLEFNNSLAGNSFYVGQDSSASNSFVVNSSTAATTAIGTIAHVQTVRGANTGATSVASLSRTFVSDNAAGNLIVVSFTFDSTNTTTATCSDSRGNTYTTAVTRNDATNAQLLGICYAPNVVAGPNTVTVTFGVSSPYADVSIHEYSGAAATGVLDVTASNVAGGTTATDNVTSTSATTTQANDLVFGVVRATSSIATSNYTAGTGFTTRDGGTAYAGYHTEDKTQSIAGSTAATFTNSVSGNYIAAMATFKAASGSTTDSFNGALLKMSQSGALTLQNSANSTGALLVQDAGGVSLFSVDTASARVYVGATAADGIGALLVLDTKNTAGDPTGVNGGMYYNSSTGKFRCYENAAWKDCVGPYNQSLIFQAVDGLKAPGGWTNMPSALTEMHGGSTMRVQYDLSNVSQVRLQVNVQTAGTATSELRVQYSTDQTTWNYLDGGTGPAVVVGSSGLKVSSWSAIAAGAKGEVYLRIVGINGDGVIDPSFGVIQLQVR